MEAVRKTNYPNLASESFGQGRKHYFIDVKKAANDTNFLLITSSEKYDHEKYHRRTVQVWEEDLGFFVEALSMPLGQLAHRELSPPETKMEQVKDPKE